LRRIGKVSDQYPIRIQRLISEVIERDRSLCVNCGRQAADVHHIIPRARGIKYSPKLWRIENMCCLCRSCHNDGQTKWMRARLLGRMWALYGYDMSWVREFGIAMEEAA